MRPHPTVMDLLIILDDMDMRGFGVTHVPVRHPREGPWPGGLQASGRYAMRTRWLGITHALCPFHKPAGHQVAVPRAGDALARDAELKHVHVVQNQQRGHVGGVRPHGLDLR